MTLLRIEVRRALHRRAVRVLIAIGLLLCAVAGVVAFVGSSGKSVAQMRLDEEGSPAIMTDWWIAADHEGFVILATFFLLMGGLLGGATYAGGEWRHGTLATVLTWEPRRLRLHTARAASAALVAFCVSFLLQVVFLSAFLPAVFAHGTTDGVDRGFWVGLAIVVTRTSALTAGAAVLAVSLATLGRNTAFAIIAVFTWMAIVESILRGLRPSLSRWLWGENLATVMTWNRLPDVDFTRGPVAALAVVTAYTGLLAAAAAWSFRRRDLAAVA